MTKMMKTELRPFRAQTLMLCLGLACVVLMATAAAAFAQRLPGTENGEWRYLGGDAGHTRYSPLDQIDAGNFADLEVAWMFRGDNFGQTPTPQSRSTPTYVDGILYTVAGERRTVVAMDPGTGETLWTFREPNTGRWERSMRRGYGKGVSYGEVGGRGVIYIQTPALFLWALDAKTGFPLENWGTPVDLAGFETGVVDLIPDIARGQIPWEEWLAAGNTFDPDHGPPREVGYVTSSSPPAVIQIPKNGLIFTLNRVTGEPVWLIRDVPQPQTEVPGNWTSPTQPIPIRPEPLDPLALDGLTEEHIIDFTPELREEALEILSQYRVGGAYMPRLHMDHGLDIIGAVGCSGGLNITNPPILDPTTNIMYASHGPACPNRASAFLIPGQDLDDPDDPSTTGVTISEWVNGPSIVLRGPQGLPIFKPPYNLLSAYDMNAGERLWSVPIGETAEAIRNHPALRAVDTSQFGGGAKSIQMVMGDLLLTTGYAPVLHARNKRTGQILDEVELPVRGQYGMMSYMHEGRQYLVVQIGGVEYPSSLVALRLP